MFNTRKYKNITQFAICILSVIAVSGIMATTRDLTGHRIVALILLLVVSINAMLFSILPVLTSAILSALIWNFFFIPPLFTFHIHNAEDMLMFILYFIIALLNTVLNVNIRKAEKRYLDKVENDRMILMHNTLLNSLSHELRTPLATIIGAVDAITEGNDKMTSDNKNELLSQIGLASERLNTEVENLLNISRLESGNYSPKLEWCDVNELIYLIINKTTALPNTRKILFLINDTAPLVKIDAVIFGQILNNLLSNALQHTLENTTIEVTAFVSDDTLHVAVTDNGQGVEPNDLLHIFDKFYRGKNATPGGTGLGLSIVKGFISNLGGKISAKNIEPNGFQVLFSLPVETTFINNLKNE
jgi:two-component system, OmpR family, sensor histidine kinase KdpD